MHDGPARAGKTDSSAGALEAPAKTNMVNGSVEVQAVSANTDLLGGMIGALEESKGYSSGYGTKFMPSNMGVVHRDVPLMILIRWYLHRSMPMPPRMYSRFYIHLIWYAYRRTIHQIR